MTYVSPEFHDTIYPRCNAEFGDVLLTKDGANTGQVTINTFREPISLLSSVCLIKPNRSKLDPRFLVYYIQSDVGFENITGQMTGAAIKRIILKNIKSSEIPLPPLEEQEQIVAVLDESFEGLAHARAHTEANLQNARDLRQSCLEQAFQGRLGGDAVKAGWEEQTLGDVITVQSGFAFKSGEYSDSGHFLIRITNVQDGYLNLEKPRYVALDAKTKRFELHAGDILTSLTGNVGRVARVESEHLPAVLNQRVARIVPKPNAEIDAQYLLRFLHSSTFSRFLEERAYGAAQANVSPRVISDVPIPIPPLEEQQQIVAVLDKVFEHLSYTMKVYQAKIHDLDNLRQSLLQKAFTGELT